MTLLELRNKCGLTQKEAAEITKTSLRTYQSYETDEDSADQLKLQRIKELLEEQADKDISVLKSNSNMNRKWHSFQVSSSLPVLPHTSPKKIHKLPSSVKSSISSPYCTDIYDYIPPFHI